MTERPTPAPERSPTPAEWRRLAEKDPTLANLIWLQESRSRRLGQGR